MRTCLHWRDEIQSDAVLLMMRCETNIYGHEMRCLAPLGERGLGTELGGE